MSNVFIYTLSDPRDKQIKYVGKTIDLNYRYKSHLWKNKNDKTKKNNWVQFLVKNNLKPEIEIIDEVNELEWQFWEQYWISQIKAWGFDLKNGDNGGLGFNRFSIEVRNKISKTLKGRKNPLIGSPILQYSLDGDFIKKYDSITNFCDEYNIHYPNIWRAIKHRKQCHGFLWRYFTGEIPLKIDTIYENGKIKKCFKKPRASMPRDFYVKLGKMGKGKSKPPISDAAKQKMKDAKLGKPSWNKGRKIYGTELLNLQILGRQNGISVSQFTKDGFFVQSFETIKSASVSTGCKRSCIKGCCDNKYGFKTAGGFIWKYALTRKGIRSRNKFNPIRDRAYAEIDKGNKVYFEITSQKPDLSALHQSHL